MAGQNTLLEVQAEGGISRFVVPVKLEKISVRADVTLDSASPNGNKIKQVKTDAVTGEPVASDEVKKGVFDNPKDGTGFREIPQDALDAIEAETKLDSFQINYFVPVKDLPKERFSAAYYLTPQSGVNPRPLKLLYEALKRTKHAGVFKLCLRSRQYPAAVYALNGGLVVNLLHFAADFKKVKEADRALAEVAVPAEHVKVATELIEALSTDASVLDTFEDDLLPLKSELVEKALAGRPLPKSKKKKAVEPATDELFEQLAASVDEIRRGKRKGKAASAA